MAQKQHIVAVSMIVNGQFTASEGPEIWKGQQLKNMLIQNLQICGLGKGVFLVVDQWLMG